MFKNATVIGALVLLIGQSLFAQNQPQINRSAWTRVSETQIQVPQEARQIVPEQYLTYALDIATVRQVLATAPKGSELAQGEGTPIIIELPMPNGTFMAFKVWDFEIMHPDLQAQYPEIRSFEGEAVDNPTIRICLDFTPRGFHAMTLRTPEGSVFIDPYSTADDGHYIVYYKKDFYRKQADRLVCHFDDLQIETPKLDQTEMPSTNCGFRREYDLAMAATGEYTTFHGGTVALALAAITTAVTRVNEVFITEISVKLNLIANNNLIIYTNGATDPYTNDDGFEMLDENQMNLDAVIGSANYDIGHVFSTGGGGVAATFSPCNNSFKAMGVTGLPAPVGDPFYIDYVCHEIGHQYSCPHTFASLNAGNCTTGNAPTAYEPGSGSTIMAYAGICAPQNVQNNSDPYFHGTSLSSVSAFITPTGHTCDNQVAVPNGAPNVVALPTGLTFPKSTPFVLNGSATDPNGHALTYCWEQFDAAQVADPLSTNTTGPLFRSLLPVSVSYRYMPKYSTVFAGTTDTWELLPSVARTLTFRLTARDNFISGGCTDEEAMTITIASNGPLALTAPNGGVTMTGNQPYNVTWNVNGTNAQSANVNILYSTNPSDPTSFLTLLSNTPNDGSQSVTVPNSGSSTVRFMIQSIPNNGIFFYDISNANNTITASLPVELTAFSAQKTGDYATLDWQTAREENNQGFAIQRSTNNGLYFDQIGWIPAAADGHVENRYQFVDKTVKPGNTYYYRLEQIDMNGKTEQSPIRSVAFDGLAKTLSIAPNPAVDYVLLTAPGTTHEDVFDITVVNAQGQTLVQRTMSLNNNLSTSNWPAGVYTVRAVAGMKVWTGKLVK
jgi:hypothetical protein